MYRVALVDEYVPDSINLPLPRSGAQHRVPPPPGPAQAGTGDRAIERKGSLHPVFVVFGDIMKCPVSAKAQGETALFI